MNTLDQQLAYSALKLMKLAQIALDQDGGEPRLHMGRDQRNDLSSTILEAGRNLGLVSYSPNAAEVEEFRETLRS